MMTEMLPHEAGDKPGHSQGMLDPELSYHDLESSSSLSSAPVATGTSLGSGIGAYILLLALSIHAFFEGLALGMQDSPGEAMILFIAIISHKACESFGLTVALMKAKTSTRHAFGLLMLFSSVSPLGQLVGIFLTQYNFMSRMATALVTAVAAGMFIYVGATEIIPEEFAKPTHKWHKFLLFMLGFVCAVVLVILTAHDH